MSIVMWVIGAVLVAAGIAGIIFPALPGHVLIFAGLLVAAWAAISAAWAHGPWR